MGFGFPTSGAQGAQGAQGASGSSGAAPNNPTNASFVGSGQLPASPGASAGSNQSSTATFTTDTIMFTVTLANERDSILCYTSYASSNISAMSDSGGYFLKVDAGVGVYIFKSAMSSVINFKNRTGAPDIITVQGINTTISSATVWA